MTAAGGGGRGVGLALAGGIDGMSHEVLTSMISPLSSLEGGGAAARLLGGGGGAAPRLLGGGGGAGRVSLLFGLSSSGSCSSHEVSTSTVLDRLPGRGGCGGLGFGFVPVGGTLFFEATTSIYSARTIEWSLSWRT